MRSLTELGTTKAASSGHSPGYHCFVQCLGHHQDCAGLSGIRLADRELSAAMSLLQLWHDSSSTAAVYDAASVQQHQCSSFSSASFCVLQRRHQLCLVLCQHTPFSTVFTIIGAQDLHKWRFSVMQQSPSYTASVRGYF